jgi:hypothetical protein
MLCSVCMSRHGPMLPFSLNMTCDNPRFDDPIRMANPHSIRMADLPTCIADCRVGSSDFPRALCFLSFWFGLEILRLVYKKAFFKILNGFPKRFFWNFFFPFCQMQDFCTFLKSRKISLLLIPFRTNFEEIFFQLLYGAVLVFSEEKRPNKIETVQYLTRFRRTSDGEVIPGPEHGFDIVVGYFSADLKSSLSHSLNMHFL